MKLFGSVLTVVGCLLAGANAIKTNDDNDIFVQVSGKGTLKYQWDYFEATGREAAHVVFKYVHTDVDVSGGNAIYGISLGLVSPNIENKGRNSNLFMQACRKLLFDIRYPNGVAQVSNSRLVYENCAANNKECNDLGGWGNVPARMFSIYEKSEGFCFTNNLEVQSVTSNIANNRQDLTLTLKLYKDSYQDCLDQGTLNQYQDLFTINFAPEAVTPLVFGTWVMAEPAEGEDVFMSFHALFFNKAANQWQIRLTQGEPTPSPTPEPSVNPTVSPTLFPTTSPTTPQPSKSPTTGVPSRSPTNFPTTNPTVSPTDFPTKSPTTGVPSKSPTPKPTKNPTMSPTDRPSKTPTFSPTSAPIEPLKCPDERQWIECSHVNTFFKHISDPEKRAQNIRRVCQSDEYKRRCYHCDAGMSTRSGCRPRKNEEGRNQAVQSVCSSSEDPFPSMGCVQFQTCPERSVMSACGSVNQMDVPKRWMRRGICTNDFSFRGILIPAGSCVYCNGVCRALAPYNYAKKEICNTPGLFDIIRGCPDLDS